MNKKKINKVLWIGLTILLIAGCEKKNQNPAIMLSKGWKFKLGDSLAWAQANFGDDSWDSTKIGIKAASKPFDNYNGFAWYRMRVVIPSSIIEKSFLKDSLKFFFGAIDDCDQVYLNGKLIGENTKTKYKNESIPTDSFANVGGFWSKKRAYVLPVTDRRILWDRENVITLRIFDQWGQGGIYSDVPFLKMMTLEDYLSLDTEHFYKLDDNNLIKKNVTLTNRSTVFSIRGNLIFKAENSENGNIIYSEDFEINLPSRQSQNIEINLPVCTDKLKLTFEIIDDSSRTHMLFTDSIPYNLSK